MDGDLGGGRGWKFIGLSGVRRSRRVFRGFPLQNRAWQGFGGRQQWLWCGLAPAWRRRCRPGILGRDCFNSGRGRRRRCPHCHPSRGRLWQERRWRRGKRCRVRLWGREVGFRSGVCWWRRGFRHGCGRLQGLRRRPDWAFVVLTARDHCGVRRLRCRCAGRGHLVVDFMQSRVRRRGFEPSWKARAQSRCGCAGGLVHEPLQHPARHRRAHAR
jgi:hypothetical protein